MKILIANQDRTAELGPRLAAAARSRKDRLHDKGRMPDLTARQLADATSEDEFLDRFIEHLRRQHGRFSQGYEELAVRPGLGGRLRGLGQAAMVRMNRGQQERLQARQGLLTELLLAVMEFQQDRHRRDVARLEARLEALEGSQGDAGERDAGEGDA